MTIAGATAIALIFAAPAEAHTFLVRSSPAAESRLRTAPGEVVLDFTEPVSDQSTLEVQDERGSQVDLLSVGTDEDGSRLRANLPPLGDGAYRVTWRVVAEDGHTTEGEFVFGVGVAVPAGATVAAGGRGSTRVMWFDALAGLALVAGLAVTFGGLCSERFIWKNTPRAKIPGTVTAAAVLGLAGALVTVTLVLSRAGVLARPDRWADAFRTRADHANVGILALLAAALLVIPRPRARTLALVPVAAAIVLVALRGHAAEAGHWWATPAAAAHILVAGAWIGALAHMTLIACRVSGSETSIEPGPSRYARAAVVAAIVTVLVGVTVAASQLERLSDLVSTRYGRILLAKLALVALALAAALAARRRGIPATGARIRQLARYTTLELAAFGGVLAASVLLSTTAPAVGLGSIELPPAPLAEPTVLTSDLAGSHQVLLAAAPDHLQIKVLPPGGQPTKQQRSTITGVQPDGTDFDLEPRPCGPGCFDIAHHWLNGATRFAVTVTNPDADGGTADLSIIWPPGPDATTTLEQAVAATRAAGEITVTETISSGPTAILEPGSLSTTGDGYISASPFSSGADSVRALPPEDGLTVITFTVTGTGTWHQLWIDARHLIRREILVDPGHRIDRTITYTNQP